MRKEWLLTLGSVVITLVVALGLIRWLAPQLLGLPADLQLVRTSKEVPPFFEGVFREKDYQSEKFLLPDPRTKHRAKPLYNRATGMGPNDILGFRNRSVPNISDVVVIGDSQSYGNNAILEENWPSQMQAYLSDKAASVYNMSVGGWGAVQYFDMARNATVFQPRAMVVAFYTGNDPLDSFIMAYGSEQWGAFIPNEGLSADDAPSVEFPPPKSEWWKVEFSDGVKTVFTPGLRLNSNQDHPAVKAGYQIMASAARKISELAAPVGVRPIFVIIPTKELAYRDKIADEGVAVPEAYKTLVARESENIGWLRRKIEAIPNAEYVDVVTPLQQAARESMPLYPPNMNGHPVAPGYAVIGKSVAGAVSSSLPDIPQGPVARRTGKESYDLFLVRGREVQPVPNATLLIDNGWEKSVPMLQGRLPAGLEWKQPLRTVDPARFGPKALAGQE